MKTINYILIVFLIAGLFTNCEIDSPEQDITTALVAQIEVPAKLQIPNEQFDVSKKGIYHGVIASVTTLSRGKIWINLGNNTRHTATIEMIDGTTASFVGAKAKNTKRVTYKFSGKNGSFIVTENTINSPEITNIKLNNQEYQGYAIKSTSIRRAVSYTGTYESTDETFPVFTGTWNLLANGTANPNGYNGIPITDIMVTHGNNVSVDSMLEIGNFNFLNCFNAPNWVPIVNFNDNTTDEEGFVMTGDGGGIIAPNQISATFSGGDFVTGHSNWSLVLSNTFFSSLDACHIETPPGRFNWVNNDGSLSMSGDIFIDF